MPRRYVGRPRTGPGAWRHPPCHRSRRRPRTHSAGSPTSSRERMGGSRAESLPRNSARAGSTRSERSCRAAGCMDEAPGKPGTWSSPGGGGWHCVPCTGFAALALVACTCAAMSRCRCVRDASMDHVGTKPATQPRDILFGYSNGSFF
jgi:hypothetical protein